MWLRSGSRSATRSCTPTAMLVTAPATPSQHLALLPAAQTLPARTAAAPASSCVVPPVSKQPSDDAGQIVTLLDCSQPCPHSLLLLHQLLFLFPARNFSFRQ